MYNLTSHPVSSCFCRPFVPPLLSFACGCPPVSSAVEQLRRVPPAEHAVKQLVLILARVLQVPHQRRAVLQRLLGVSGEVGEEEGEEVRGLGIERRSRRRRKDLDAVPLVVCPLIAHRLHEVRVAQVGVDAPKTSIGASSRLLRPLLTCTGNPASCNPDSTCR